MRFRVSDEEYDEIKGAANEKEMSYAAFIVHTVRLASRDNPSGSHAELYQLCEELRAVARQVNRVGVNLNQVARIANSTGSAPEELPGAVAYLTRVLRRTEEAITEAGLRLR